MNVIFAVSRVGKLSQTFTSSLIRGLGERIEGLSVLCDSIEGNASFNGIPMLETGFYTRAKRNTRPWRVLHKALPRLLSKQHYKKRLYRASSHNFVQAAAPLAPDVIFIEFGNLAVTLLDALRELKVPFVIQFLGIDITAHLACPVYRARLAELFSGAAALVCVSEHLKRLLILAGAPPEKVHVVRLDVDASKLIPMPYAERLALNRHVCFLGRLTGKKHPLALIEAHRLVVDAIPEAQLVMIGDGPLRSDVNARIRLRSLENNVQLLGALPHEQALEVLRTSRVYAQHSVTSIDGDQEGFPVSLAEAAVLEVPLVATRHSGIPENIVDGETGFLVPEHDYVTMAERIIYLLNNPEHGAAMGQAGRLRIAEMCQPQRRFDTISRLLQDACAR